MRLPDMHLPVLGMIAGTLVLLAAPALGASRGDHDNCNSDDPDRIIAGCTRIIDSRDESRKVRAIAYVSRGFAWKLKGDIDRSIADLTGAIRLNPMDVLAYNNRGLAWHDKGDMDRSIADLTAAIRINPLPRIDDFSADPGDLAPKNHINVYVNRGITWRDKGDLEHALSDYDQAIRFDPTYRDAYYNRGLVWRQKRELDRAIADYDAAIRLDPTYNALYYNRGIAWYDKGDYDRAISDYDAAIGLDPNYRDAYYARGNAWRAKGDLDRATADLTKGAGLGTTPCCERLNPAALFK